MTTSSIPHNSSSSSNFQPTEKLMALLNRRAVVCRIIIKQTHTTATGFLIGENLLMTNHHVIKDREQAKQAEAQFFYFDPQSETITVALDPDTFFHTSPLPDMKGLKPLNPQALDFTIVAIKVHKKIQAFIHQAFLLSALPAEENTPAYIIHHPLLKDTCYQQISCQDNQIIQVTKYTLHYTTATLPGSSGAPVMDSQGQLVALHRSQCTLILGALIEEIETLLKTLYPYISFEKETHPQYGQALKGLTPQGPLFIFIGKEKGQYILGNSPLLSLFHLFPGQHKRKAALEFLKTCGRDLEKHQNCNTAVSIKAILASLTPEQRQVIQLAYQQAQNPFLSLKERYLLHSELTLLIGLKPLPIEKQYTTLAIITEKENKDSAQEIKKASADQRIATYESIFQPKEGITLETVFENAQLKEASQKRILIQGSAGIGKSTLCQKIAYQWAKGDLWPEFKTLFWIKFRHLNEDHYPLDKKYTLDQLIENECDLPLGTIQKLTKEERKHALILLDGYDEFHNTQQWATSQGKFSLLEAFQREFPHIILTTRPQSGIPFQKTAEMEILGFDNQGITSYVDRFFSEEKQKEKQHLLHQLKDPLIHSLCHIPINLEIFCSLGFEGKILSENTSPTLATLYTELTEWLIERFGKERLKGVSFKEAQDFNQIEAKTFIDHLLEEVGWKLMEKNALFISLADLQNIIGSYPFQSDLAKTIKHSQIGPLRFEQQEGHFIHLTFQEFFAAKYLARLFKENQLKTSLPLIQQKKYDPRYQLVISMVSGILAKDPALLQNFFDQLHKNPRDLGGTRELILFARYFEQCGDAAKSIRQYGSFVQAVRETLDNPEISDGIKLNLLIRNRHLLHQKEIIELFLAEMTSKRIDLLTKTAEQGTPIPEQIVDRLCNRLCSFHRCVFDDDIETSVANALGEIAQGGAPIPEKAIERLSAQLLDPKANDDAKSSAARVLGEIAKGGTCLAERALRDPIALLLDPKANYDAKRSGANALGEIAKGGAPLPEKVLEGLIALRLDPKANYEAKSSAEKALEEIAKGGTSLSEKVLEMLINLRLNPKADYETKRYAEKALQETAKGGTPLSEKVLEMLINLLLNPKADYETKRYVEEALEEIAKGKTPLSEKAVEGMSTLLLDSEDDEYDDYAKWYSANALREYAANALGKVAKGGTPLSEKALEGLSSLLLDPEANDDAKSSATRALGEVAKGVTTLPKEVLERLSAVLLDPKANYHVKSSAANALGKVAKGGAPLPEKVLERLSDLLLDPKANDEAKSSATRALGEVAKGVTPLPKEVLERLSAVLLDPKANYHVKSSAANALGKVAKGGAPLPEKAVKGLSALLIELKADKDTKSSAARVFGEMSKGGTPFPEKTLRDLVARLLDPKYHYHVKSSAANVLEEIVKGGIPLPEKALNDLSTLLLDPKSNYDTKSYAVGVLGEVAKGETPLPEKALEGLISLLLNPKANRYAKNSAARVLGEVAKRGTPLPEKALEGLIALLLDPKADEDAKGSAASALGEIAEGQTPLAEKALRDLIALLLDGKNANYSAKRSAAVTLGNIAKGGKALSETALEGLSALLLDPKADKYARDSSIWALGEFAKVGTPLPEKVLERLSDLLLYLKADHYIKDFAVEALRETAKGGRSLPEKALIALRSLVLDSKANYSARKSAAETLGEIAKGETRLAEKALEGLVAQLLDPMADDRTKWYVAEALGEVGKGGKPLPEKILIELFLNHQDDSVYRRELSEKLLDGCLKSFEIRRITDIELLSEICKCHERSFYEVNLKYYIANQREVYQVKKYTQTT